MRVVNQEGPLLLVYLLEQHRLAADYLLQQLAKDRRIRAQILRDPSDLRAPERSFSTLVVDNCGLGIPLSEFLRRLRLWFPLARSIVLDKNQSSENVARLLWLGIHGFIEHRDVHGALVRAVHRVSGGGTWFSSEVLQDFAQNGAALYRSGQAKTEALTPRENEVIELVKRRLSNKEIADILKIRESTVKFHLSNIFSKSRATSRKDFFDERDSSAYWSNPLLHAE